MSKIWLQNGTKISNTSSHVLLDHFYTFGLLLKSPGMKKIVVKEMAPLWPTFACAESTQVDLAKKQQYLEGTMSTSTF